MITEIGIVAGEIWQYLDKNGNANLNQLSKGIKQPKELILMSLGWLAREGHITLGDVKSGHQASLTPSKKV